MRTRRPGSTQSRTLDAIKASGEITIKGLQAALGLDGARGYARVSMAAQSLMKAGYIERSAPGTYKFIREPQDMDYSGAQRRMVRVIRIRTRKRSPITARALSELAGCSLDWAKKYLTFLSKQDFIERVGFERVGPCKVKAAAYLGNDERLNEDWPALRRNKKTSEIDGLVERLRGMAFSAAEKCEADEGKLMSLKANVIAMGRLVDEAIEMLKR